MFGGIIGDKLRTYREYATRLGEALLFRTTWFRTYDTSDGKVFVDASRFIYAVGSAVVTISAVLYFVFNTSRPEFYELIPIPFVATMGLVCFIMLSVLRVYRITFVEFFVCFAYVMGTYCVVWLLGRLVRNGIALYPHEMLMAEDVAAIPQTLRDICRNPDSPGCREYRQTTGTRQLLDTVDLLLKYWEWFLAIYFSAALAVFLSKRARPQTLGIIIAVLIGLGTYFFVDRGMGYAAQYWLGINDCKAKPEYAQFAIKDCKEHANSKFHTIRFYAHYRLALAFENQMDRAQSVSEYINAIRYDPNFTLEPDLIDRLSALGRGYAAQGHYTDGLTLLSAAVQRRPWDAQILTRRGTVHMEAGNVDAAIKDFTDATNRDPNFGEAHFSLGWAMESRNDLDSALNSHRQAVKLQPKEVRFLRALGRARSMRGEHDAAMTDLKNAIGLAPMDSKNYYEQAQAYQRQNNLGEAKALYLKAIRLDKAHAYAHRALARLQGELKDFANSKTSCEIAISIYNEVLKGNENSLGALIGRATCLFDNEQDEGALADYAAAIRINPRDPTYYIMRGDVYVAMGEQEQAIADFTTAIKLDTRSAAAYSKRGVVRSAKREYDLALQDLKEAIDLDPQQAAYHWNRGLVHHALGKYPSAIEDYSRALTFKPDIAAVLARRCALRAMVQKNKAVADAELAKSILLDCDRATQIGDNYPARIAHYRGIALWNLGRKQEAEGAYRLAYGEALQKLADEREKSARECEKVVEGDQKLEGKARQKRAEALGRLSWYALFAGNFECALKAANLAIKLAPAVLWPKSNRAHARMFLGEHEVARRIYLERQGETIPGSGPWEKLFLEEFQIFRESGLDHPPLVAEVENEFRKSQ